MKTLLMILFFSMSANATVPYWQNVPSTGTLKSTTYLAGDMKIYPATTAAAASPAILLNGPSAQLSVRSGADVSTIAAGVIYSPIVDVSGVYKIQGSTAMAISVPLRSTYLGNNVPYSATAIDNIVIGQDAFSPTYNGKGGNAIIGVYSGPNLSLGSYNTHIGNYSGLQSNIGFSNVFVGYRAGVETVGSSNTFVGGWSGSNITAGGNYNILLGYGTDLPVYTTSYYLNIGNAIKGYMVAGSSISFTPNIYAPSYYGSGSNLTGVITSTAALQADINNRVLKAGDTMTGQLNGTSAVFSGAVTASSFTGLGAISGLTTNTIPKATAANALGNSQIFDNGTNVGIGTVSPAESLSVAGNGLFKKLGPFPTRLTINSSEATAGGYGAQTVYNSNTSGAVNNIWTVGTNVTANNNAFEVFDNATTRLRLNVAGSVEVPGSAFSVGGSTLVVSQGRVGILGTSATAKLYVVDSPATAQPVEIYRSGANNVGYKVTNDSGFWNFGKASGGFFGFSPDNIDINASSKLVISVGGNVGIGTASPVEKLDVAGNITNTGQFISSGTGSNYINGYKLYIATGPSAPNMFGGTQQGLAVVSGNVQILFGAESANSIGYLGTRSNDSLSFKTNSNEVARFNTSGFMGIGTASPAYKVDISSGALAIKGTGAGIELGGKFQTIGYAPVIGSSISVTDTNIALGTGEVCVSTIAITAFGGRPIAVTGVVYISASGGATSIGTVVRRNGVLLDATPVRTLANNASSDLSVSHFRVSSTAGAANFAICFTSTSNGYLTHYDWRVRED